MNSRTTRRFRELFAALPAQVQRQAREAYRLFRANPAHPGLHFKQVHPSPPVYSARVSISYRSGTRIPTGARIGLTEPDGRPLTLEVEALGYVPLHVGCGYGGDSGAVHHTRGCDEHGGGTAHAEPHEQRPSELQCL